MASELEKRIARANEHPLSLISRDKITKQKQRYTVLGTTGNQYKVKISCTPSCSCPDFQRREISCKHILFILMRALHIPEDSELLRRDLTDEDLIDLFEAVKEHETIAKVRKVQLDRDDQEEDCPICLTDMGDNVVYCALVCGKAVHKTCFKIWAETQRRTGQQSSCPYCRAPMT